MVKVLLVIFFCFCAAKVGESLGQPTILASLTGAVIIKRKTWAA